MIFLNLDSLDKASNLTKVCEKYDVDFDVFYGRYIIDGKSVLGVASLIGHIIKIETNTNDSLLLNYIIKDLEGIGAWVE